jgi:signal-transduction protein with cAMP-binding, CBS, and nucleotidyltransferase domain
MLAWGRQLVEPICSRQREQGVMKIVMNMVRKPFKKGEVIFETNEKSDELFLINSGKVEIRSREGFLLATLGEADPVLRALIRNLTNRFADANQKNEDQWQQLNIYRSLAPDEIQRP